MHEFNQSDEEDETEGDEISATRFLDFSTGHTSAHFFFEFALQEKVANHISPACAFKFSSAAIECFADNSVFNSVH